MEFHPGRGATGNYVVRCERQAGIDMCLRNTRTHRLLALAALLVTILGVGSAAALPVNYNEAIDGPLPIHPSQAASGGPTPGDFLTLDVGINTFAGSAIWSNEVPNRTTLDTAPVTLPGGMGILSLNFSVTNIGGTGTLNVVFPMLAVYDAGFALQSTKGGGGIVVPFAGAVLASELPVNTAGNYGLCLCGFAGSLAFGQFASMDYTWTAEVVPGIPEASSLVLVAVGLAGIFGLQVARRSKTTA